MAQINRIGFGQVEPNQLSGIVTGQMWDQLPLDTKTMGDVLEQGRFAKYDYANGKVNLTGAGEWLLVYNETKLYDERKQSQRYFAMQAKDYIDGEIVPRLIRVPVGDIFTTNTFGANTSDEAKVDGIALEEKDFVSVDSATGYLKKGTADDDAPVFQVAKVYTMPDGQPGVKLQRVK